jgi:NAD(P)-dependent dehydrogenase (short-subunit alcohol dehydrogenase family)
LGHPQLDLTNKIAVVIGGTSGIGLAIAGADVVATGRRAELARSATQEIRALGRRSIEISCDVTDESSLKELLNATCSALRGVQILANCAGITKRAPTLEVSDAEWNRIVDTNLNGTLRACRPPHD